MQRTFQFSSPFRSLIGVVFCFLVPGVAGQKPEERESESDLDSVSVGIENLELLKRGLDAGGTSSLDPNFDISAPEIESGDARPLGGSVQLGSSSLNETQRLEAWRQENWLLAGMQGDEDAEEFTESGDRDPFKPAAGSSEYWLQLADQGARAADAEDAKQNAANLDRLSDQVVNPLEGFMTDWLDASLQNNAIDEAFQEEINSIGGFDLMNLEDLRPETAGAKMTRLEDRSNGLLGVSAEERINPYTHGLSLTAPSLGAATLGPANSNRTGSGILLPEPMPSAGVIAPTSDGEKPTREPWRPPEKVDDKYFRRLNHF